jgi:hypothetical protein
MQSICYARSLRFGLRPPELPMGFFEAGRYGAADAVFESKWPGESSWQKLARKMVPFSS